MQDINNGRNSVVGREGVYDNFLYFLLNFSVHLKLFP